MREHPAKEVMLHPGILTEIDEEIVDLVSALCELGWNTHMSCQNNGDDRVWVSFYHSNFAVKFMELVAQQSKSLSLCVRNATTEKYDKTRGRLKFMDRWWVDSYIETIQGNNDEWTGDIVIRISVRFPRHHLKEVTRIIVETRDNGIKTKQMSTSSERR